LARESESTIPEPIAVPQLPALSATIPASLSASEESLAGGVTESSQPTFLHFRWTVTRRIQRPHASRCLSLKERPLHRHCRHASSCCRCCVVHAPAGQPDFEHARFKASARAG